MRTLNNRSHRPMWLFPIVLSVCAAAVAFGITSLMEKSYKSESSIYFPAQADPAGGLASLASLARAGGLAGAATDKSGGVSLLNNALSSPQIATGPQTAIAVLDSNLCRQRVVDRLGLARKWELSNSKALKKLDGAVTLGVDKNGLLALEAVDSDPTLARDILVAYRETLEKLAEELSLNISKKNRIFVEERVRSSRERMAMLEKRLLNVSERDPDPVMSTSPSDAARGIVDLEKDLVRAQVSLSGADRELAVATRSARAIVQTGLDLPTQSELGKSAREKLSSLEFEFSLARATLGPDNPRFRELQYQLNAARAQVKQEITRASNALDKGIAPEIVDLTAKRAGFEAQVAGLARAVDQVKARLASVPSQQLTREHLVEELKIQRDLVAWLEMELGKARIAEQRDATTFQVIDAPNVPDEPVAPRRVFASALAAVAGLLVGIAFLVARASMRPDPEELLVQREVSVV